MARAVEKDDNSKGLGSIVEKKVIDIAEALGDFLGQAEAQWNDWKGQRDSVVKSLVHIRERASQLLSEIGGSPDAAVRPPRRQGRPAGATKKAKRTLSAETRAKMAAAAKRRWARRRQAEKKAAKNA